MSLLTLPKVSYQRWRQTLLLVCHSPVDDPLKDAFVLMLEGLSEMRIAIFALENLGKWHEVLYPPRSSLYKVFSEL